LKVSLLLLLSVWLNCVPGRPLPRTRIYGGRAFLNKKTDDDGEDTLHIPGGLKPNTRIDLAIKELIAEEEGYGTNVRKQKEWQHQNVMTF